MSITVNLKTQRGEIKNRQFNLSEGVSVYGSVFGMSGMFEPGTHMRFELLDANNKVIEFDEKTSNIFGDYDFWFRTPAFDTNLTIKLTATYSISGQDQTLIPIGVGNRAPANLPGVKTMDSFLDWLPIVAIAAVAFMAFKLVKD